MKNFFDFANFFMFSPLDKEELHKTKKREKFDILFGNNNNKNIHNLPQITTLILQWKVALGFFNAVHMKKFF